MQDFKKLRVWRHAHALALNVNEVARKIRDADYASLRRQLIKTGCQVSANIVEGREKSTEPEFARHLDIAKASVSELEEHLMTAHDLELISHDEFHSVVKQLVSVRKMLTKLIQLLRKSIEEEKSVTSIAGRKKS